MNLKQIIIKLQNKQLIEEFENLEVSDYALKMYRTKVRGNFYKSNEELIAKLKRNFLCGQFKYINPKGVEVRHYGNLIIKAMDNKIIYIWNQKNNWSTDEIIINKEIKNTIDKYIGRK
ncbi:MAG: hypothetical protein ACRDD7_06365 [Peptostreptococcaceae bacterium]